MARYALNLPAELKRQAEDMAASQEISLNQFILWAVSEKLGELKGLLDDPAFPRVCYRRGASGQPLPVIRGTGIRVQTLLIAAETWAMSAAEIAEQFGLKKAQVDDALAFCQAHRAEVEALIAADATIQDQDSDGTREAAIAS